jgi:HEPN domain-containing protein
MITRPIKLSDLQHKELQEIAKALIGQYKIEKIICFAALNSSTSQDSVFAPAKIVSASNYYLLVMTTDVTRMEHAMQDYIGKLFPGTMVIAHGLETVMNAIDKHDRFFWDACRYGSLIYTADGLKMSLDFEEAKFEKAVVRDKEAFGQIHNLATGFMECGFDCYEKGFYNNVAFVLHQAVEQGCRALIRLFTGYRSDIHNLERLLAFCSCFSKEPAALFRRQFEEEKKLFRLLVASYTEARYRDNYQLTDRNADLLCSLVKTFLDLVIELSNNEPHNRSAKDTVEASAVVGDYSPALPASL